jgi:tubulin beta
MRAVRKEAEHCECLEGFQLTHSLGGGTGSGMGSLLMARLREEFPKKILTTYSVLPAKYKESTERLPYTGLESYNTVFSLIDLNMHSDLTVIIDNEAVCRICCDTQEIPKPACSDLNRIISLAMSGMTSCLRFPRQRNDSITELSASMVPVPRLNFVVPAFAPLTRDHPTMTIEQLAQQILDATNTMAACDPRNGHDLAFAAMFQGPMSTVDVDRQMIRTLGMDNRCNCNWILKSSVFGILPTTFNAAATLITNTTAIKDVFTRILEEFNHNLRTNQHISKCDNINVKRCDFLEAKQKLTNLVSKYASHNCQRR